jgi:serine/threonine protein kinase
MRCGTTYTVTHETSRERAALDVYDVPPLAFGSYTDKLRPLMHMLEHLGHPGVVKIHDVGTLSDGRPYVVRERVDGRLLSALVAANPLREGEAIAILRAICEVLVEVHRAGAVHRSLVLEHVAVLPDGSVKLLDWGLADELAQLAKPGTTTARRAVSATDDVYWFGGLMHRLLKWVPRSLEALWIATLAEDPTARPTMQDIQRQLAALPAAAPPRVTKARGSVPPPIEARVAQHFPVSRMVTLPGIAPPPVVEKPATALDTWEVIVAHAAPDFDHEEQVETIEKPPTAPALVVVEPPSAAAPEDKAEETCAPEPKVEAPAPVATAYVEIPKPRRPGPKAHVWIWHVLALATACAVPVIATIMTARNPHEPRAVPAAIAPVIEAPPVVPPITTVAVVEAPPVAQEPVADEPIAKPAPTRRATKPVDARPMAAREAPAPKRSKLVSAAVPAAAVAAGPSDDQEREALMLQYQRVGHSLLLAKRDLGPDAVAEITKRFQWLRLDAALSKKTLRQLMAKTLQQLQAQINAARAAHMQRPRI